MPRTLAAITAFAIAALALTDCTSEQRRAISQAVVRNVVAVEGAKEFKDHGFPIQDHLACKATASPTNETHVAVSCTGTTTQRQSVTLVGTSNGLTANHGLFVGTVDGQQVFAKACLDC